MVCTSRQADIIVNGEFTKLCALQKGTTQGYLFYFSLEVLTRDVRWDEEKLGLNIKNETYK